MVTLKPRMYENSLDNLLKIDNRYRHIKERQKLFFNHFFGDVPVGLYLYTNRTALLLFCKISFYFDTSDDTRDKRMPYNSVSYVVAYGGRIKTK